MKSEKVSEGTSNLPADSAVYSDSSVRTDDSSVQYTQPVCR